MFINKIIYKIKSSVTNFEFGLLKRRANHYSYNLVSKKPLEDSEIVIENFFETEYKKNALLSYIIYPFSGKIQNNHSNHRECFIIAEILKELGYNVDVINWNNTTFLPVKKYDVVIDNHNNLERLSPYFTESTMKIFHATNTHWLYQNSIEYGRYYDFFLKKGVAITPARLMFPGNSAEYCDAISIFGNEFTESTYGVYRSKMYHLPMSVTTLAEVIEERDYSLAKKKFIWLNSHGVLLKGLDIVIDAFSMLPHLELYICGDLDRDGKFKDTISLQLSKAPNIKIAGWVDIEGEVFKKIVTECAWVISTSFSEGGGGSTLNCMAKGLIPVVSSASSLTLPEKTGFYLEENNAINLAALLSSISLLPDAELSGMSFNTFSFVASNHTLENFKNKYKEFLIKILESQISL